MALGVVGLGQFALAVSGVVAAGSGGHDGGELSGATAAHLVHEASAWNLALAVQEEGTCYPTPTLWRACPALRFSIVNADTSADDIHSPECRDFGQSALVGDSLATTGRPT